jgi:radical SAM protein with 4Fe4S-binding SPASM domain
MNARLRDTLNFLRKATPRRVGNAAKVLGGYYYSRFTKKPYQMGLPISISIEPTTSCNLRCPECPSGLRAFSRPTGMLTPETFGTVIDQLHRHLWYLILYFQGEPYLNPNFFHFVRAAADKKIYTATSTNAHYLSKENARKTVESGLDRLIISIDGTTQEVYQSYRIGGKLEKVLDGTKNLVAAKKELKSATPHIIFQFLVVEPNRHQIADATTLANEMGVDEIRFKSAQVYDYENGNPLIPADGSYSRYKQNADGTYSIKNKLENRCWKMWHSCVITWDGSIVPCCFDKDATHKLGNLKTAPFKNIWQSADYQRFRGSLLQSRKEIDICQNCTEGGTVWL